VTADTWSTLDSWWDTYATTVESVATRPDTLALDSRWYDDVVKGADSWWESFTEIQSESYTGESVPKIHTFNYFWKTLDPWWSIYISGRGDDVARLQAALDGSNVLWKQRGGHLNQDPLSTGLDQGMRHSDPLNPEIEEDWSDWLAHLLRTDKESFRRELLGDGFGEFRSVEREDYLPETGGIDRYADIVLITASDGISIEVKIGDTNYTKTTHTAELLEAHYDHEWHHFLLLPEWNVPALRASINTDSTEAESDTVEDERPMLATDKTPDVEVLYWSDISRTLRTVLLNSNEQHSHWAASAYLFCTLIEQVILGFSPKPTIDRLATGADTATVFESASVPINNLKAQTEYLQEFIEADVNE